MSRFDTAAEVEAGNCLWIKSRNNSSSCHHLVSSIGHNAAPNSTTLFAANASAALSHGSFAAPATRPRPSSASVLSLPSLMMFTSATMSL